MLDTPVLFIVFNRPDTAAKVFERIRAVQPKRLYIIADGPRQHIPEDAENCRKTRAIVSQVDWECEVKTDFKVNNVGPEVSIKTGLNWFFNEVEFGIILEDDCLPDLSFFEYCERLLIRHKENEDISIITGTNFSTKRLSEKYDYFIGNFTFSWGWASWSRVFRNIRWGNYYSPVHIEEQLQKIYGNKTFVFWLMNVIRHSYKAEGNWDTELFLHIIVNNKRGITPAVNLISNIGDTGTHYKNSKSKQLFLPTLHMNFSDSFEERFIEMPKKIKDKIISNFLKLDNPLTLRDKLYLIRKRIFI